MGARSFQQPNYFTNERECIVDDISHQNFFIVLPIPVLSGINTFPCITNYVRSKYNSSQLHKQHSSSTEQSDKNTTALIFSINRKSNKNIIKNNYLSNSFFRRYLILYTYTKNLIVTIVNRYRTSDTTQANAETAYTVRSSTASIISQTVECSTATINIGAFRQKRREMSAMGNVQDLNTEGNSDSNGSHKDASMQSDQPTHGCHNNSSSCEKNPTKRIKEENINVAIKLGQGPVEVSEAAKTHADRLKEKGNEQFRKGEYRQAILFYDEAIKSNPYNVLYYSNRTNAYKQLNQWDKVVEGARETLQLDDESVKAHYLLGLGLVYSGCEEEGLKKLIKAKTLSASQNVISYERNIEDAILEAKNFLWKQKAALRKTEYEELLAFVKSQMEISRDCGILGQVEYVRREEQLNKIFDKLIEDTTPGEIPNFLCCKISMGLMRDPVCIKSGVTYEKALLLEHFKCNGEIDPISRTPCSMRDMIPNYAIKEGTHYFLEKYPWAADAL